MILLRVLAFTLCGALVYALYLPAVHPPERFVEQVRAEHALNVAFWGEDIAHRILNRSLALYDSKDALTPAAFTSAATPAITDVNVAVAHHMGDVVQRLFHNRYTQGVEALSLLALYRCAVLLQWLPWIALFVTIAGVDGYIVRIVRSKEFLEHSPVRFALCAWGATLALALGLVLIVIPTSIAPLMLGGVALVLGALAARAISHFHR